MPFDLYQLDRIPGWDEGADVLEEYIDGLSEALLAAPEGRALAGDPGYWVGQAVRCAYVDLRVTLPSLSAGDVRTLLTDVFPRKLGRHAPEPERAGPELTALWTYLRRAHGLKQAAGILQALGELAPDFPERMAQGEARSLQEQAAELTPTEEQQAQALVDAYRESQSVPESFLAAMKSASAPPDLAALFGGASGGTGFSEDDIDLSELEPDRSHKRKGKRRG